MPRRVRIRHHATGSHVEHLPPHPAHASSPPPLPPPPPAVDIAYTLVGNGPQPVLFIPGMCVSSAMWHHQRRFFAHHARYTLLLIDNRGAGHSSSVCAASSSSSSGFDMHTMARDALAVLDFLFGSAARFHVVGHSMGSMIAQRLVLLSGVARRVCSLALLSGHDGGWFWNNIPTAHMIHAAFDMLRAGFDDFMATKIHVRLHYTQTFLNSFMRDSTTGNKVLRRNVYYRRYLHGIRRDKQRDHANHAFWAHLHAVRTHNLSHQDAKRMMVLHFPKLVLYGQSDPVVLPRASRGLAQRIGAPCLSVPGSHFIVDECAAEVNALLQALFERGEWRVRQPLLTDVKRLSHLPLNNHQ
ncbi:unnamed protein product [Agarophyton chilense]|eukprot:gb/GEZJ01006064.1/.p1 GENE.gb/GEZJ01006064.1/~~gb/GEZJ01006064.1/.p1  ORF type:complete len:370 (+),score=53.83 gb/GEZJ01006064.1/:46-1110(+)